jgi:hypothetical protein
MAVHAKRQSSIYNTQQQTQQTPNVEYKDVSTLPTLRLTGSDAPTQIPPRFAPLNSRPLELPRTRLTAEQHIDLRKRPILRLRQPPPTPQQPDDRGASPEEPRFSAPSPSRGIQHPRRDEVGHDAGDVVAVARQRYGLGAEACGRDFGDEDVAHGADGGVVYGCEDEEEGGDGPGDGAAGADAVRCDCAAYGTSAVG